MIDLSQYMLEHLDENLKISAGVESLKQLYSTSLTFDLKRSPKSMKGTGKHSLELMRGYFGVDEDEVMRSVRAMLSTIGINDTNTITTYEDVGVASGEYNAVKVTATKPIDIDTKLQGKKLIISMDRGDYLYIINTCRSGSRISKKTLTPDNLGITNREYYNTKDLIQSALGGLKGVGLEDYRDVLGSMCSIITKSGHNDMSLDEILDRDISYTIKNKDMSGITHSEFNNIANDFGEVLGPLMLMSQLSGDVELRYPKGSNAKLYDYIINGNIFVSAKAGKRGGVPSAVDPMRSIQQLVEDGLIDTAHCTPVEREFLEKVVPLIADSSGAGDLGRGSAIRKSTWSIVHMLYSVVKDAGVRNFVDLMSSYGIDVLNKGIRDEDVDRLYDEGSLGEVLSKAYSILNYKPNTRMSIEKLSSDYKHITTEMKSVKEGCLLYPVKSYITSVLNSRYDMCITKYANMVMTGYQVYLLNNKTPELDTTITFRVKKMSQHSFKLSAQGSTTNPLLKNMGIVMGK